MKFPFKTITLSAFAIAILALTYVSCNKDNNTKSTTVIKCVTCANGGSCINDTCRCPAGYEGTTCQTLSISKFIGEWNVFETGSVTSNRTYFIQIEETSASLSSVIIQNLYSPYYFSGMSLTGSINGDSIFIPNQPLDSGYIVGKGCFHKSTFSGQPSTISFRYQVTNTITGVTNDFGYSSAVDSPSVWTLE